MNIVGYADQLSVQPGETIQFMVSCEEPAYRADVVRLVHGDDDPRGPGFKEELIETAINGEYAGRAQAILSGAYVAVPDSPLLGPDAGFSLQAWVYPTTPQMGVQGILTKWSDSDSRGYGLFVDEDGGLSLWIGDEQGRVVRFGTGVPFRGAFWYFVAAAYDAERGRVRLYQEPVSMWPMDESRARSEAAVEVAGPGSTDVPFLMAGYWGRDESGKELVQGHFNGKIDSPRLFSRALTEDEIESLRGDADPLALDDALIAAWDFSKEFSSDDVTDTSANRLHGKAVNVPTRANDGPQLEG